MRIKKHETRGRIKSNLHVEFVRQDITSYSGLELMRRYFHLIGLHARIRRAFREQKFSGDYSIIDLVLVLVVLWLTGGRRLSHVSWIQNDPLVKRITELKRIPSNHSLVRLLKQFTNDSLQCLSELNSELVLEKLNDLELPRITLDFDGTILTCGDTVGWAARGYNPHNRHAKSYYPLLCHVSQTGHFLNVKNRPGNRHDSKGGALDVIRDCVHQIRLTCPGAIIEIRLDAAFFTEEIVRFLLKSGVEFAIKMPMWKRTGIKDVINARKRWKGVSKRLSWFQHRLRFEKWDLDLDVTIYRQKISDRQKKKNFQLDLFSPDDGIYEYSALMTNKSVQPQTVFDFYNGRCAIEKQIAELKGEFAFDAVPTHHYQANSAYQKIGLLGYNLVRNFQFDTGQVQPKKKTTKRTTVAVIRSLKTLRFQMIHAAGRIIGARRLRLNTNPPREARYQEIQENLDQMAA